MGKIKSADSVPMMYLEATKPAQPKTISLAAAVNSQSTLENCLRRSPDVVSGEVRLRIYEGYSSAGKAYNQALADSEADILILAHQDVYLPSGFLETLRAEIEQLDRIDPDWALAGVIGLNTDGVLRGHVWSTGLAQLLGKQTTTPVEAATLDELMLVVREASGLMFDPELPSFHLYAADAIETAKAFQECKQ